MVDRSNRSATTTFPASSAGRISRSTRSARAARIRNSSAAGAMSCFDFRASFRAASATGVPPGSRTVSADRPRPGTGPRASAPAWSCPPPPAPPPPGTRPPLPRAPSTQRDDRAGRALLHAVEDPLVDLRHQLLEVSLRGHHLLIHRIALDALEGGVGLLHELLGRLQALLRRPFQFRRQALDLPQIALALPVLPQPLAGPPQGLVLLALPQEPAEFLCFVVDHASSPPAGNTSA